VVFVDLRGFTGFTETAEPEEVMGVLREYHAELGRAIMAYDGTIEHFAGDGVMILFNDPVPVEDHELQAIRMTLRMRDSMAVLAKAWTKRGYALGFGVGIAGGYLVGVELLGGNPGSYWSSLESAVEWKDVSGGILKSISFGLIVSWVCCYKGYSTEMSAEGLGKATTEAVVLTSVLILVWDYFLTSVLL